MHQRVLRFFTFALVSVWKLRHDAGLMQECFRFGPEPDAALCNAVATACEARQAL